MEKMLASTERQKLIVSHCKKRDGQVRNRIKAVLAYDDGYSYSETARILLLDNETTRRHIDAYQQEKKIINLGPLVASIFDTLAVYPLSSSPIMELPIFVQLFSVVCLK